MNQHPEFENAIDAALDLIGGAYGHKFEVGPATLNSWRVTLGDCTPREIEGAAVAWVREAATWPPSAPELLARIMRERATHAHRLKFQRATVLEALQVQRAMEAVNRTDESREAFIRREGRGAYLWWSERAKWARGVLARATPHQLNEAQNEDARQRQFAERAQPTRSAIPRLSHATDGLVIPVTAQSDAGGSA